MDINDFLEKHFDKDHCNLELFGGNRSMALVENSIRSENDTSRSGANVFCDMVKQLGDNHPDNKND